MYIFTQLGLSTDGPSHPICATCFTSVGKPICISFSLSSSASNNKININDSYRRSQNLLKIELYSIIKIFQLINILISSLVIYYVHFQVSKNTNDWIWRIYIVYLNYFIVIEQLFLQKSKNTNKWWISKIHIVCLNYSLRHKKQSFY